MQIANPSIPSNRCQLPSDRAIKPKHRYRWNSTTKKRLKSGMNILSVNEKSGSRTHEVTSVGNIPK